MVGGFKVATGKCTRFRGNFSNKESNGLVIDAVQHGIKKVPLSPRSAMPFTVSQKSDSRFNPSVGSSMIFCKSSTIKKTVSIVSFLATSFKTSHGDGAS